MKIVMHVMAMLFSSGGGRFIILEAAVMVTKRPVR